ncbi:hypothetical protein C1646_755580 [Rhizophagus diaphanus]|nr:hypothetical protein C1646_755580 [Rhizophagus diaphanus] [Rhizophagus sp. MUCL 43196]
MKKDIWLRLTTRRNNPLSEEQARDIRSDIEELLTKEADRVEISQDMNVRIPNTLSQHVHDCINLLKASTTILQTFDRGANDGNSTNNSHSGKTRY